MSYSRWLTSYWYTYWQTGVKENKDNARFCICTLAGMDIVFSAKELREDREQCLNSVREIEVYAHEYEIDELNTYMDQFIDDVNIKYPL